MKKLYLTQTFCLISITAFAQVGTVTKNGVETVGPFESIRNNDFTQLAGIATSGISVNYNSDKATINGSFTLATINEQTAYPKWIQLQPTIGTTTTLFELGQNAPQPDFSLASSFTMILYNKYFYDGTFTTNYSAIQDSGDLNLISTGTNSDFHYTETLRKKLNEKDPKLKPQDNLYTAKRINWLNIVPEFGGAKYTYFDKNRSFSSQIYKPYYNQWGLTASFNHYWYVNNDDVHWDGFPTTRFFYYKLAVRYGSNNNSEILRKTSINDVVTTVTDPATSTTRQVVKSTSGYSGIYEDYNAISPSFEVLYSFVESFAFNFFGNYNIITSDNITTSNNGNLAAGLYFYSNSNKSKVNIGIYYQRTIGDNSIKEIIGLKSKVPIRW